MQLLSSLLLIFAFQVSGWEIFADTKFEWWWVEEYGAEVAIPIFDSGVKKLDGQEVTLTGHYLPIKIDGNRIILSRLPFASCFFCNSEVGQESVAEIEFKTKQRRFNPDEIITVKGKLKLNKDDYDRLIFIIEEAKII